METVTVVISEILGFLAIAWLLGFFVAWAIFRAIKLEYKNESEEYEENVNYLKNIIKNQEKEITKLTREVQALSNPKHSTKEFLETQKKKQKKQKINDNKPKIKKEIFNNEDEMLQLIKATLEKIN